MSVFVATKAEQWIRVVWARFKVEYSNFHIFGIHASIERKDQCWRSFFVVSHNPTSTNNPLRAHFPNNFSLLFFQKIVCRNNTSAYVKCWMRYDLYFRSVYQLSHFQQLFHLCGLSRFDNVSCALVLTFRTFKRTSAELEALSDDPWFNG